MMEIKIEDYLSEEEIKEICKDVLYQKISEDMRELNVNDIIAGISYAEVAAMVDTYVGEDDFCKKEIPEKVHRVIDDLSTYTVFRRADVLERKNSIAYDIMQEECRASRPLIKARVEQIINEYKFPQLERDEIMYTIAHVLTDRLLPEKEEE
jgi:predicted transcriptional regulator YdeE